MNDIILSDKCPLCDIKLEDTGDGLHFFCSKCSNSWLLDDLESKLIQKNLEKWF